MSLKTLQNTGVKRYIALLNQTGLNAPTEIILFNEIGKIIWTRNGAGEYFGTLTAAFNISKTAVLLTNGNYNTMADDNRFYSWCDSFNVVKILTTDSGFAPADDLLKQATIEIMVFI